MCVSSEDIVSDFWPVRRLGSVSYPNSTSESIQGARTMELEGLLNQGGIGHSNLVGQGMTSTATLCRCWGLCNCHHLVGKRLQFSRGGAVAQLFHFPKHKGTFLPFKMNPSQLQTVEYCG